MTTILLKIPLEKKKHSSKCGLCLYDINNGELWNYHNCSQNYKTYLEVFVKWSG